MVLKLLASGVHMVRVIFVHFVTSAILLCFYLRLRFVVFLVWRCLLPKFIWIVTSIFISVIRFWHCLFLGFIRFSFVHVFIVIPAISFYYFVCIGVFSICPLASSWSLISSAVTCSAFVCWLSCVFCFIICLIMPVSCALFLVFLVDFCIATTLLLHICTLVCAASYLHTTPWHLGSS